MDDEYSGYRNRPTWLVSLWLDNDECEYNRYINLAAETVAEEGSPGLAVGKLADAIQKDIEERNPVGDEASMFADLMGYVLAFVDWIEIAQGFIDSVEEGGE